jgi:hypothetical protein
MKTLISDLSLVDFIGDRKGTFRVIVKVPAGFMSSCDLGSELPTLDTWKKGSLQTIEFCPDGYTYYITVFARKGNKIILMDKKIAENLSVGTINQLFSNTNLYSQNQYSFVKAKTWEDKAFVLNE